MRWTCRYCPLEVEAHPNSADAQAIGVWHWCREKRSNVNLEVTDDE